MGDGERDGRGRRHAADGSEQGGLGGDRRQALEQGKGEGQWADESREAAWAAAERRMGASRTGDAVGVAESVTEASIGYAGERPIPWSG
jgi:hypothetical protein